MITLLLILTALTSLGIGYLVGLFNKKAARRMEWLLGFLKNFIGGRDRRLSALPRTLKRLAVIFLHRRRLFLAVSQKILAERQTAART